MHPEGLILLDVPAGYNPRLIKLAGIGEVTGWQKSAWCHLIPNAYKEGKTQAVNIFRRFRPGWNPQYEKKRILEITPGSKIHTCEFDRGVIRELISFYSYPSDTVLDGFCGTGIVPGEAVNMGRRGIGIDIRPYSNIREEYQ